MKFPIPARRAIIKRDVDISEFRAENERLTNALFYLQVETDTQRDRADNHSAKMKRGTYITHARIASAVQRAIDLANTPNVGQEEMRGFWDALYKLRISRCAECYGPILVSPCAAVEESCPTCNGKGYTIEKAVATADGASDE